MNKIFKYAPEGAVSFEFSESSGIFRFLNSEGRIWCGSSWKNSRYEDWAVVAEKPQEQCKTVNDVVEAYPNGWPYLVSSPEWGGYWIRGGVDIMWAYLDGDNMIHQEVCTLEEYEQKLAESKQKWTHTIGGQKCRVLIDKPDSDGDIVILRNDGEYELCRAYELKPTKPKLTKSQAFDKMNEEGLTLEQINEQYEVVE